MSISRFSEPTINRYRLNARLDEQEVARFELEYDVQLPSEYREFLICIGNGGAGPYYGLLPLDKAVSTHGERSRAFLSAPFPLTKAFDPYCESSDEEGEEAYDIHVRGSIAICHEGCGYYDRLVISGPQKGQMWFDGRVSDQGLAPLNLTFADWYGLWLSESMADLWRLY